MEQNSAQARQQHDEPLASSSSSTSQPFVATQILFNDSPPLDIEIETTDSLTPVAGHVCVEYRGTMLCWGGYCYDERDIHYRDCNWLYVLPYMLFGVHNSVWIKVHCETDLNLRPNSGATAAIYKHRLYIFGGCLFDDSHRRMLNTSMLLAINLRDGRLIRKRYPLGSRIPTPRDKTTSWIADDKFFIFGGYGMSWHRLDHSQHQYFFRHHYFLDDDMGSCWNNQLLYYDLIRECWEEVEQGGTKPSARAASACAYAAELGKVFLFGGRHDQTRLNDLYVLDTKEMIWNQIDGLSCSSPDSFLPPIRPEGRSWCTFTLLNNQKKILCFGGLDPAGRPLSDLWELDIGNYYQTEAKKQNFDQKLPEILAKRERRPKHKWRQIPPLDHQMPPRLWHGAVLMEPEAILYYGGMNEAPSRDSPFVRTLLIRRLCPPTLRQLSLSALSLQIVQRWTSEMSARKMAGTPENASGSLGRRMNADTASDLLTFASRDFFPRLPLSLHAQLQLLLPVRKHAKALNLTSGGGSTPRASSPIYHWQYPVPLQFHMLHLVDGRRTTTENHEDTADAHGTEDSTRPRHLQGQHHPRCTPLSPKSQKRALADELTAQICILGRRQKTPFLQTFFNVVDCLK